MYTLERFKNDVIPWSKERLIIQNGSIDGQQQKGREECAETIMEINNILKNGRAPENLLELKKEVGGIAVILTNVDYMQESRSEYYFETGDYSKRTVDVDEDYKRAVRYISKLHTLIDTGIEEYSGLWDYLQATCYRLGINLSECAQLAFKKIEHRKGYFCKESMSFVKEVE